MEYFLPLNEIVTDFFNELKHITSGYGSFDYEDAGFKESKVVKACKHLYSFDCFE